MDIEAKVEKLRQALETCVSIMQMDGTYDITYKDGDEYLRMNETVVTLSTFDPRLPLVIDAMLHKRQSRLIGPEPIRNTLHYWSDPLKIKADENKNVIKSLIDVAEFDTQTGLATVAASGYELHHAGKIEFVDHTRWGTFWVHHDELEKHFPGWLQRFNVASGLGLEDEARVAYIFQRVPSPTLPVPTEMPNITF